MKLNEFKAEFIGFNGTSEKPVTVQDNTEYDEIQMRISVSGNNKIDINRFGKEVAPLILTGPSGVTGFAGGRPKASEIVAFWPALLDKKAVEPRVKVYSV